MTKPEHVHILTTHGANMTSRNKMHIYIFIKKSKEKEKKRKGRVADIFCISTFSPSESETTSCNRQIFAIIEKKKVCGNLESTLDKHEFPSDPFKSEPADQ